MPKVIHSLQLHISYQMRSYSCPDHLMIELYQFFWVVGHQGNLGEKGANIPKSSIYKVTQKEIQSPQLLISFQMRPYASVQALWVELYLFHRYSGIGAIWGNWARIPQIMCKDTRKVIQNLQLFVSHQIRHYSSVRTLCGSSYTCFTGTRVLGQFGEIGPTYLKSCAGTHEK